jgi:beta-lactamase superfamily II metal-dependent hydrolase
MPKRSTSSGGDRGTTSSPGRTSSEPQSDTLRFAVHLLDVGPEEYGDAVLCQFGDTSVLIDGAHSGNWKDKGPDHPSIQRQIGDLLQQSAAPYKVSLLIVTHAHADHIGCLPKLVEDHLIEPEWALVADPDLGWGISPGDAASDILADAPVPVRQLAAALREETRRSGTAADLAEFVADAANLEDNYRAMLHQLAERGTKVVRLGPDDVSDLLDKFRPVGLEIVGPTVDALVHCAELNQGRSTRLVDAATALLGDEADFADAFSVAEAYRRAVTRQNDDLTSDAIDAVDALGKDKGSINDESIVTRFRYKSVNLLFTGDMQLSDPEVSDSFVTDYIKDTLRGELTQRAPYDLVKLPHHGSYNGFDEEVYQALGKPVVIGMCSGSTSKSHPNAQTLQLLKQHRHDIQWARTDHNGCTTFTFTGHKAKIKQSRGRLNDTSAPGQDELAQVGSAGTPPEVLTGEGVEIQRPSSSKDDVVEVTARIPNSATRVTLTVDISPGQNAAQTRTVGEITSSLPRIDRANVTQRSISIGAGRALPKLLVLTNREALAGNIGGEEGDAALAALKTAGHTVVDSIVTGSRADGAAAQAKQLLNQNSGVAGVLLLGGYDVVPAQRVDALPTRLRDLFSDNDDADDFIVWSDDAYGDREGDTLPELPVSRIPDGRSAELLFTALQADVIRQPARSTGLRNVARPFADDVYSQLPSPAQMLKSRPTVFAPPSGYSLDAGRVYIMLHGSDADASRFWGEDDGHFPVAMEVENVPSRPGMVAFTGCCWGALPVRTRAKDFVPGHPLGSWTPGLSIALTFLKRGARAFIGCTGSHYSPTRAPYGYFGGPMHDSFWRHYSVGRAPAESLFNAKAEYMRNIPHTQAHDTIAEAIEFKILREYTCLGLGW